MFSETQIRSNVQTPKMHRKNIVLTSEPTMDRSPMYYLLYEHTVDNLPIRYLKDIHSLIHSTNTDSLLSTGNANDK